MKNIEWNMASEGDGDFDVAIKSSEVFRNFAHMAINKEGVFGLEDIDEDGLATEESVTQPLMRNNDYVSAEDEGYLDKLIAEAQDAIEEVGDVEEEVIDTDSDGMIDDQFSGGSISDFSSDSNEYETGAGDSKFLDIGLSNETMKDIKDDGVMSSQQSTQPAQQSAETTSAVKDVMDVYDDEEIADAEQSLGLDSNAAYIFGKGREV